MCRTLLDICFFQPKYRFGRPEIYLCIFIIYNSFSGSKYPKHICYWFWNQKHCYPHIKVKFQWLNYHITSKYSHALQTSQTCSFTNWGPILHPNVAIKSRSCSCTLGSINSVHDSILNTFLLISAEKTACMNICRSYSTWNFKNDTTVFGYVNYQKDSLYCKNKNTNLWDGPYIRISKTSLCYSRSMSLWSHPNICSFIL